MVKIHAKLIVAKNLRWGDRFRHNKKYYIVSFKPPVKSSIIECCVEGIKQAVLCIPAKSVVMETNVPCCYATELKKIKPNSVFYIGIIKHLLISHEDNNTSKIWNANDSKTIMQSTRIVHCQKHSICEK